MTHQDLRRMPAVFRKYLIEPRSMAPDERRQEYILNILLVSLAGATVPALLVATINYFSAGIAHNGASFSITIVFLLIVVGLIVASRRGKYRFASYAFLTLLGLAGLQLLLQWGFMLPSVLLTFAMITVIAGVLVNARRALQFTALIIVAILVVAYAQLHQALRPDLTWLRQPFHTGDAIGYVAILGIIGIVSWLANREIDRSLRRARASERALAAERDSLEIKVKERTRQLEETQLVRLMELQHFAEFGRLSANLLHEVANPLMAAALNLEELKGRDKSRQVRLAHQSLRHLERYVSAARQQLKGQSENRSFAVLPELRQVIQIISPVAKQHGVLLQLNSAGNYRLYGDPVKFSQLSANLILNAVEAYSGVARTRRQRQVEISVEQDENWLHLNVHDWGKGISKANLAHIFEPFYSTKATNKRSLGIGLAMVRQYVEDDFHGGITVDSTALEGTSFALRLRRKKTPA